MVRSLKSHYILHNGNLKLRGYSLGQGPEKALRVPASGWRISPTKHDLKIKKKLKPHRTMGHKRKNQQTQQKVELAPQDFTYHPSPTACKLY